MIWEVSIASYAGVHASFWRFGSPVRPRSDIDMSILSKRQLGEAIGNAMSQTVLEDLFGALFESVHV